MKLLAFSGSLRPQSHNTAILRALASLMPDGTSYKLWEGLGTLPHFSPEIDFEATPGSVIAYRALLKAADAVIICTPEFAFGMPGVLKNALDWAVSSGELNSKPVGTISASPLPSGGEKAMAWLQQTLTALGANQVPGARLSIPGIKLKLTQEGHITDPSLKADLQQFLTALLAGINTPAWQ